MDLSDDIRRVLGLAEQILEELPDKLRPNSNIEDMRALLAGETSGRDGLIIAEAIATALAYLTQRSIAKPLHYDGENSELFSELYNTRLSEFMAMFELIRQIDAWTFTTCYLQTCIRIGTAQEAGRRSSER